MKHRPNQTSIAALSIVALALVSCATPEPHSVATIIQTIQWSDGDSGHFDEKPFRLANVDAPETGGVGARGGARCEAERALGDEAKAYMEELTRDARLRVADIAGTDKYGRQVVAITADGADIAIEGLAAGHLAPWPHRGQQALAPKPLWCADEQPQ